MFSTALGAAYGAGAFWQFNLDWGPAALGGGLTAIGGLMPDLDSDSGVPVRELFGLAAALTPFLLLPRVAAEGWSQEQVLVILAVVYLLIRYGLSTLFKHLTVHRGMFHSIPAMLIAGLLVFDAYHHPQMIIRLYLAGGVMLGFLSHLVLDELCSVDLSGAVPKLNNFAGSALKFMSPSWSAVLVTYTLLLGLAYTASLNFEGPRQNWANLRNRTFSMLSNYVAQK
jgi:hypothetical protein